MSNQNARSAVQMGNQNAYRWTPEREAQLRHLWGDGLSASEVAARLGGTTRGAVIGKVHRLKLPPRPTVISGNAGGARKGAGRPKGSKSHPDAREYLDAESKRRKAPTSPSFEPEPFDMEDGEGVDVTSLIGIMDLTAHTCRYPVGDPLLSGFGYCGKHTDHGPYCDHHRARCTAGMGNRL